MLFRDLFLYLIRFCHHPVTHHIFLQCARELFSLRSGKFFSVEEKWCCGEGKVHDLVKFCLFLLCHFGYIL